MRDLSQGRRIPGSTWVFPVPGEDGNSLENSFSLSTTSSWAGGARNNPALTKENKLQTAPLAKSLEEKSLIFQELQAGKSSGWILGSFWMKQGCSSGRSFSCSPKIWVLEEGFGLLARQQSRGCWSPDFPFSQGVAALWGTENPGKGRAGSLLSHLEPATAALPQLPRPSAALGSLGAPGPWSVQAPRAGLTPRPVLELPQ